jgi:uncharacterized protein YdaU (DUF1376 family)
MIYYPFHVRDYVAATRHLSMHEDLAYRRLLDAYYTAEQPLPRDAAQCARMIAMREYVEEVGAVLNEFFVLAEDGWHNQRADEELGKYRLMAEAGRRGAQKRWGSRGEGIAPATAPATAPAIGEVSGEGIAPAKTKSAKVKPVPAHAPEGVDPDVWSEFVAARKKRGSLITKRVMDGIKSEAEIAGWTLNDALKEVVLRGWQSFKAEWVSKGGKSKSVEPWEVEGAI